MCHSYQGIPRHGMPPRDPRWIGTPPGWSWGSTMGPDPWRPLLNDCGWAGRLYITHGCYIYGIYLWLSIVYTYKTWVVYIYGILINSCIIYKYVCIYQWYTSMVIIYIYIWNIMNIIYLRNIHTCKAGYKTCTLYMYVYIYMEYWWMSILYINGII